MITIIFIIIVFFIIILLLLLLLLTIINCLSYNLNIYHYLNRYEKKEWLEALAAWAETSRGATWSRPSHSCPALAGSQEPLHGQGHGLGHLKTLRKGRFKTF